MPQETSKRTSAELAAFKRRDYDVLLIRERDDPRYAVICPELGCASQGDTRDEAISMITDAVTLWLDCYLRDGETPPTHPNGMAEMLDEYPASDYMVETASIRPIDWDDVIASCTARIEANPADTEALIERGGAYLSSYNERLALADYENVVFQNPEVAAAYRGRGEVLCNMGNYDDAVVQYDAALRLDPYDEITLSNLRHAYVMIHRSRQSA